MGRVHSVMLDGLDPYALTALYTCPVGHPHSLARD
jgi:hypothetical protein